MHHKLRLPPPEGSIGKHFKDFRVYKKDNYGHNSDMKHHYYFCKKFGFTLAEVLITLGIIGVVAALTLTNLITNYQKRVTINRLKTAYSIFAQAVNESVQDNGSIADWEYSYTDMAPKYIFPYVETIGTEKSYALKIPSGKAKFIHWGGWTTGKIYQMKNGMTYSLIFDHGGLYLTVDINGKAKPNRMGKDGFTFVLSPKKNKLILAGSDKSRDEIISYRNSGCSLDDIGNSYYKGQYCGALIMIDDWQIKDYYPW